MIPARIPGATDAIGKSQGYFELPIRQEIVRDAVQGDVPAVTTAWTPSPSELEAMQAGASIYVQILCPVVFPMSVTVGPIPEE